MTALERAERAVIAAAKRWLGSWGFDRPDDRDNIYDVRLAKAVRALGAAKKKTERARK